MARLYTFLLVAVISVALLDPIHASKARWVKNLPKLFFRGVVQRSPTNPGIFGLTGAPIVAPSQPQVSTHPATPSTNQITEHRYNKDIERSKLHTIDTGTPAYEQPLLAQFEDTPTYNSFMSGEIDIGPVNLSDLEVVLESPYSFLHIPSSPRQFPMGLTFDDTLGNTIELRNPIDVVSATFTRAGLFEQLPKDYETYDIFTQHLTLADIAVMEQWHSAKMIAIHLPLGETYLPFGVLERLVYMNKPGRRVHVAKVKVH